MLCFWQKYMQKSFLKSFFQTFLFKTFIIKDENWKCNKRYESNQFFIKFLCQRFDEAKTRPLFDSKPFSQLRKLAFFHSQEHLIRPHVCAAEIAKFDIRLVVSFNFRLRAFIALVNNLVNGCAADQIDPWEVLSRALACPNIPVTRQ